MNIISYSNNRRFFLIIFVLIGVFCGLFSTLDISVAITIVLGFLLGVLIILMSSQSEDYKFLFKIFTIGFLSRLSVSTFSYFLSLARSGEGFLIMDDGYDASYNAWEIAKLWREGLFPDYQMIYSVVPSTRLGPYHYWNGFVYFFTGWNPLVMFFINCAIGAITIILVYLIAKEIFNKKIAIISSLLFAFWPSLFLWSTMNSKDPLTIFFICLTTWSFTKLRRKFTIRYLLIILSSILILYQLRTFVSMLFGLIFFISFLLLNKKINKKNILIKLAVGIILLVTIYIMGSNLRTFTGGQVPEDTIFKAINYAHYVRTIEASSAFFANIDISTPLNTLLYLPFGLLYAIFSPFPWKISSSLQLIAIPEMLIWYILLPFIFKGILISFKLKWKECSVMVLFILFMYFILALFEGNVGTLFRHRSLIIPFCLIFAAVSLAGNTLMKNKEKHFTRL